MITDKMKSWSSEKIGRVLGQARAELAQMTNGERVFGDCVQHEYDLKIFIQELETLQHNKG